MFGNLLRNLKWALVIAIFAGPGFAYFSYTEAEAIKKVMAEGVEATAAVDGAASESGRRRATTYTIHAIWADDGGVQHAADLDISSEFADQVIEGDYIVIDAVQVKYTPGGDDATAVVIDDADQQIADKMLMVYLGAATGVIGLIGSAIFFLTGRRKAATPA
jgi:hypothetical protein